LSNKEKDTSDILVGADLNTNILNQVFSYESKDYTFTGELKNYNYEAILKDKQTNIIKLYELSNYFVDADSIFSGIIKRVLVPFSLSCGYKLKGISEKAKQKYFDYYEAINFLDIARSIFYEMYLFANCFIYFMPDGSILTLPPHRCRISTVMVNGEPVIDFNVAELNRRQVLNVKEDFLDSLLEKYKGYPPEITQALQGGNASAWIQLNPVNTFVLQEPKPMWQKYAIPMVTSCLKPLAKKELISFYEDNQMNIGAKGFLHAKLGHDELLPKPNQAQLNATAKIFQDALNKFPLAVTSHFVDAKFIAVENQNLFDKSKYTEVNSQILSSGGISPVIVTGESDGSSFAQANISVRTASERIKQNQNNFCEMMKKYNRRLAEIWRVGSNKIPTFVFNEVDLIGDDKIKEEAFQLWQQGCISSTTLLEEHGLDVEQEYERRLDESSRDFATVFAPPTNTHTSSGNTPPPTDNKGGRPPNPNATTDKNKSATGKNPKPSNQ